VPLLGCVPVVADTDGQGFNTSAEQIEPLITGRTRAVIVAHIMGEPVGMDPVVDLARAHNLYVIEDCAQSPGARHKGRPVGTMGDIACFSTMFSKHFTTGGQGGIVYTRNEELHQRGRRFADRGKPFGMDAPGNVRAGLNCNLNEIGATIGSVQLKRLPEMIQRRRAVGETVKDGLREGVAVTLGRQTPGSECSYWYLRVTVDFAALRVDRATLCEALAAEGIPLLPEYPRIPCTSPWFAEKAVFGGSGYPWECPDYAGPRRPQCRVENAKRALHENITICMHEGYGPEVAEQIVAALKKLEAAYLR
jgi:dTDP-4-amino-4,6-dideoxygalactose transaminase